MNVQTVMSVVIALGVLGLELAPMNAGAASASPMTASGGTMQSAYEVTDESSNPEAMFALGVMFDEGINVPPDYEQAFQWYARAAELGHADAMNRIGILYATGRGVPHDYVAAFGWYLQAARNGSVSSASNIATAYFHGLGVQQSYSEAAKWLEPAAASGDAPAQNKLGVLYNDGLGVTKDPRKAFELFQLSASQGYAPAMVNLGGMHADGTAVERDDVRAYALITTALELGIPDGARDAALYQLGVLAGRLDEKRLEGAQRLARQIYTATQPATRIADSSAAPRIEEHRR